MQDAVRRKLDMALRVRDFSRTHPFTDPSASAVLARFEERLTRAEALAVQQRTNQLASRAANARKNLLREAPLTQLLRHLVRVAEAASRDQPELAGKLKLPPQNRSTQAFLAAARSMIQAADTNRDVLISHGMPEAMLADLGQALTQFEAAAVAANGATQARAGARADLEQVAREVMEAVRLLDGLNRYRFREDRETLNAWSISANLTSRSPTPAEETPTDGGTTPPAEGGSLSKAA